MRYFCNSCRKEIDLKRDRVQGKYLYECCSCKKQIKKVDLITIAQVERRNSNKAKKKIQYYDCSSCDAHVDIDETDNYGRCEKCQEEYGDIE